MMYEAICIFRGWFAKSRGRVVGTVLAVLSIGALSGCNGCDYFAGASSKSLSLTSAGSACEEFDGDLTKLGGGYNFNRYPCGVDCEIMHNGRCSSDVDSKLKERDDKKHYVFAWLTFIAMWQGEAEGSDALGNECFEKTASKPGGERWSRWCRLNVEEDGSECDSPDPEHLRRINKVASPTQASMWFSSHSSPGEGVVVPQEKSRKLYYENRLNARASIHLARLQTRESQGVAVLRGQTANQNWGSNRQEGVMGFIASGVRPAMHAKSVWIDISNSEADDFITVVGPDGKRRGLIALHLAINLNSSNPFWAWATFEHRRALENSGGPAFFRDTSCEEECPAENMCSEPGKSTQIVRQFPFVENDSERKEVLRWQGEVKKVNDRIRALIGKRGLDPRLRNYDLIGVQRSLQNSGSIEYEIRPKRLANAVIEWDRQEQSSCIGCHSHAPIFSLGKKAHLELCAVPANRKVFRWGKDGACILKDSAIPKTGVGEGLFWLANFDASPASDMFWGHSFVQEESKE